MVVCLSHYLPSIDIVVLGIVVDIAHLRLERNFRGGDASGFPPRSSTECVRHASSEKTWPDICRRLDSTCLDLAKDAAHYRVQSHLQGLRAPRSSAGDSYGDILRYVAALSFTSQTSCQ